MSTPNIPQPRSLNAIIGGMVNTFLSYSGISKLRIANPILSIMQAAAQSDFRNSQDVFSFLKATSLDNASGTALLRLGADEKLQKIPAGPASGTINIGDSAFQKVSSTVFAGTAAPIAGSSSINVASGSGLDSLTSGSVYLGRGTADYEGPIAFSAVTVGANYTTLTLSTSTQNFHNVGESVILAQGGNRSIPAQATPQTTPGAASSGIQFLTLYAATLLDGENLLQGVPIVATLPGLSGNVPAGTVNTWASPPFATATVTNPLPFSNGTAIESDDSFRERIREARASKTQGTSLAITSGVIGLVSPDENKTILSASLVAPQGQVATLYIDDGTGYEEIWDGVAFESLMDSANGGEQNFQVAQPTPITKALVLSENSAPFALSAGAVLAVKTGDTQVTSHSFPASDFGNIGSASAFEVVASINSDTSLDFVARTANAGTQVVLVARADTEEDIKVVAAPTGDIDANAALAFPMNTVRTMRLYHNDRLLNKDGLIAQVTSLASGLWGPLGPGNCVFTIAVDGTAAVTYTISAQSFISAGTGFTSLGKNSLQAWAAVLQYLIPGISVSVSAGALLLTSNLGANSRAGLAITATPTASNSNSYQDLVGTVFKVQTSLGLTSDYSLDRNTGQLTLTVPLSQGDSLTAGTEWPRAFVQNQNVFPFTASTTGNIWFAVDSGAQLIGTGVGTSTPLNFTVDTSVVTPTWGDRVKITQSTPPTTGQAGVFTNVQIGDWILLWDPALASGNRGLWRVGTVDNGNATFGGTSTGGQWIEFGRRSGSETGFPLSNVLLSSGGIVFIRTLASIQDLQTSSGTNTSQSFISLANGSTGLVGATALAYHTNQIRVSTNSFDASGDIAVVAQDVQGAAFGFSTGAPVANIGAQVGAVTSGAGELGTPHFWQYLSADAATPSGTTSVEFDTPASTYTFESGDYVVGVHNLPDKISAGTPFSRFGSNYRFWSQISTAASVSGTTNTLTTRQGVNVEWVPTDRAYEASHFALGSSDQLTVVVDGNTQSQRFAVNMYRRVAPHSGTSYGSVVSLDDLDNGASATSLVAAFGASYNWKDFMLMMQARTNIDQGLTTDMFFRYYRFGGEGNNAQVRYVYPMTPSQSLSIAVDTRGANSTYDKNVNINITLPSGAAITSGEALQYGTYMGLACSSDAGATATASSGQTLPTGTITTTASISGFPASNGEFYITTTTGTYKVTYSAASGSSFTGCSGGLGSTTGFGSIRLYDPAGLYRYSYIAGYPINTIYGNLNTTVQSPSGGASLPVTTLTVASTTGFPPTGYIQVATTASGTQTLQYTGLSGGNTFTGVTGGTGTIVANGTANSVTDNGGRSGGAIACILGIPPGIGHHGFTTGQQIYVNSSNSNVPSGNYQVVNLAYSSGFGFPTGIYDTVYLWSPTLSPVTAFGPASNAGTVSADSQAANFPTGTAALDIFSVAALGTGFEAGYTNKAIQIPDSTFLGSQFVQGFSETDTNVDLPTGGTAVTNLNNVTDPNGNGQNAPAGTVVPKWELLGALTPSQVLQFYPLANNGITAMATAINALTSLVSAVAIGNGGTFGNVTQSSMDENLVPFYYYPLFDGINYVASAADVGGVMQFTLKNAVTTQLTTGSNYASEVMRLVPLTTSNICEWLNTLSVSGLGSVASVSPADQGHKIQVSTDTLGSSGSIQVQGGSANTLFAAQQDTAVETAGNNNMVGAFRASDTTGLVGGTWVALQNSVTTNRNTQGQTWQSTNAFSLDAVVLPGGTTPTLDNIPGSIGSTGSQTVTTATNFVYTVGNQLWIDTSSSRELVTVTTGGSGTFTANFTKTHSGGAVIALVWNGAAGTALFMFDSSGSKPYKNLIGCFGLGPANSGFWVEQMGSTDFFAYSWDEAKTIGNPTGNYSEGMWLYVTTNGVTADPGYSLLPNNDLTGNTPLKIVRVDNNSHVVWIENPGASEAWGETQGTVVQDGSVIAGDTMAISTTLWGVNTIGNYTVLSVGVDPFTQTPTQQGPQYEIRTGTTTVNMVVVQVPAGSGLQQVNYSGGQSLGTNYNLVQFIEGVPARLIKKVTAIAPNQSNSSFVDIHFDSPTGYAHASVNYGTTLQVLDKLQFPTMVMPGSDGYAHSVGLIGEANLAVYSDDQDVSSSYPGIIASGANINISGPFIKRVQISVGIRINSNNKSDVEEAVQNAVASFINSTPVGQPIVLSKLLDAVDLVNGVSGSVMLSPTFGPGSDEIPVAPQEKPMVINLETDVSVNFIGS